MGTRDGTMRHSAVKLRITGVLRILRVVNQKLLNQLNFAEKRIWANPYSQGSRVWANPYKSMGKSVQWPATEVLFTTREFSVFNRPRC